ncbi:6-phosphogluconolactonase [Evansella sp. AB-P1]|uniref:6-phosphogluconolactonase n=1 Tax=Evansella sp. AB-P1 TaxID=3037653 RepID=UPI00241C5741|nr:6-phosphogluconolactonase [Evansella sp. AB-P1]MDG5788595.1 6-phosphogluconolactonase [Evansella sp. AB-P1]
MEIVTCKDALELGIRSAEKCSQVIKEAINKKGTARIVLSTGKSQFETLKALVAHDIEWNKVEMFHLDEYVYLSEEHPASFRKYLKERFTNIVSLKRSYFVDGEGDLQDTISFLNEEITKEPIDLAIVGIGENSHIAFNDPPADFDTKHPFIIVNLDEACKNQQVREGWFSSIEEVPTQAISMSVHQILKSKCIVSPVPYVTKAKAIKATLESDKVSNEIPATALKKHQNVFLYLDNDSASLINENDVHLEV